MKRNNHHVRIDEGDYEWLKKLSENSQPHISIAAYVELAIGEFRAKNEQAQRDAKRDDTD